MALVSREEGLPLAPGRFVREQPHSQVSGLRLFSKESLEERLHGNCTSPDFKADTGLSAREGAWTGMNLPGD